MLRQEPGADHPIDAGTLGEYALLERTRNRGAAADTYPSIAAHLRGGCQQCQDDLAALEAISRSTGGQPGRRGPGGQPRPEPPTAGQQPRAQLSAAPSSAKDAVSPALPEPLEIAAAVELSRLLEAECEVLRTPLPPDRPGVARATRDASMRLFRRRWQLALAEAGLIRQRLAIRRLFLERAAGLLVGAALPKPKARLLLDDLERGVDELSRLSGRLGRITGDLRRLTDDPRGPSRSQAEALLDRATPLVRDALAADRKLARVQGMLSGMLT